MATFTSATPEIPPQDSVLGLDTSGFVAPGRADEDLSPGRRQSPPLPRVTRLVAPLQFRAAEARVESGPSLLRTGIQVYTRK